MKTARVFFRHALLLTGICAFCSLPIFPQEASDQTAPALTLRVNHSSTSLDTDAFSGGPHGTVVVGIALSDGIVLAGDSRLTQTSFPLPRVISDSGSKVFDVGKFGIATYGEAFFEKRTVASWIEDFRSKNFKPSDDIDQFATAFAQFFQDVYSKSHPAGTPQPVIGFLLAGYDSEGKGKVLTLEFPKSPTAQTVADTRDKQGIQWNGQTDVIQRLVMGYDPLMGALPAFNSLTADQQKAFGTQLPNLQYNIAWNGLMLQDGVDLATTFIKATMNMQRFANGTLLSPVGIPGVGGDIDVLVIKPSGLLWVRRKALTASN
jgi:hypothetical protein